MKVHEIQIDQIEWSSYLLGFRTNIFIEKDEELQVGDLMILQETVFHKAKKTGRCLAYKMTDIDRKAGKDKELIIYQIELKRLKEYNYKKAIEIERESGNGV